MAEYSTLHRLAALPTFSFLYPVIFLPCSDLFPGYIHCPIPRLQSELNCNSITFKKAMGVESMRGDSEEAGSLTEDHDSDSSPATVGKAVSSNASSSLDDRVELERMGSGINVS
jgi:hypothetical protein